jgi:phage gpG-like protein
VIFHVNDAIPAVPTGLTAGIEPNGDVLLNWTDVSTTEFSYRAEYTTSATAPNNRTVWAPVPNGTALANATQFLVVSPVPANARYYRVVAVGQAGSSNSAAAAPVLLPAPPTNLLANPRTTASVTLTWTDNSNNETGFQIFRRVSGSSGWAATATAAVGVNVRTYTDATALVGVSYDYQVVAVNAGGASAPTNVVTVAAIPAPLAATGVTATVASPTSVTLSWVDSSTDETAFVIQRAPVTAGVVGTFATLATAAQGCTAVTSTTTATTGTVYTCTNTGLTTNSTYAYRIVSTNVAYPAPVTAATPAAAISAAVQATPTVPVPLAPSNLTANVRTAAAITLNWTDNSNNETGFQVQRRTAGTTAAFATVATTAANVVTYTDNTAVLATNYEYQIVAIDRVGGITASSAPSNTVQVVWAIPAAPVLSLAQFVAAGIQVQFTDQSTTETRFQIQRAVVTNGVVGTFTALATTVASTTGAATGAALSFTDTVGLAAGGSYAYQVVAQQLVGNTVVATSLPSNVSATLGPLVAATAPTGLVVGTPTRVAGSNSDTVPLTWVVPTDPGTPAYANYLIQYFVGTTAPTATSTWTSIPAANGGQPAAGSTSATVTIAGQRRTNVWIRVLTVGLLGNNPAVASTTFVALP